MANIDLNNRSPRVERLPDLRQRITRTYDVLNNIPKIPADLLASVWLPWGTQDDVYTSARLIKQDVTGQLGEYRKPTEEPPKLVRVFEEIPALAEVVVGNPDVSVNQYGYKEVTLHSIQFSAGTAIYSVPGTTPAPAPWGALILRDQDDTDDGTLRTIKRTYVEGGELSDIEELKFGGKLLIRNLKYLNQVPPTPSGYTLITHSKDFVNGLPVYTYGFANASGTPGTTGGKISNETEYVESPDQGTTGVTITTIMWVTDYSVSSNPTTGPGGSELISAKYSDEDGYRMWTVIYASGQGVVATSTEIRNSGNLVVYSKTSINAVPSAPAPTIGGTVVLISSERRNGERTKDGTVIYEYRWAEGFGSTATELEYRNRGKLVIYSITALGVAPSAPSPTIGGTVVLISTNVRTESGYTIYEYRWAEGKGVIDVHTKAESGGLRMESWISLGDTYDASFMLPPGILMVKDSELIDGVTRWTVVCMQNTAGANPLTGDHVASAELVNPGNYEYISPPSVTFSGGGGTGASGHVIMTAGTAGFVTGIVVDNGGSGYTSPPLIVVDGGTSDVPTFVAVLSNVALTRERFVRFTYPGRALAVNLAHPDISGSHNLDIQLSPPIETELIGTEETSYSTDDTISNIANPYWSPVEWATVFAQYTNSALAPVSKIDGIRGYRAFGGVSSVSVFPPAGQKVSVLGSEVGYIASVGAYLKVFGGPDAPDGLTFTLEAEVELAFVGYDGTKYYRRIITYATIPAQNPLPIMTSVVMIATNVTGIASLKAVVTAGAPGVIGGRTNGFQYTWTQGGVLFTRFVRPTLVAGTLTSDTTFWIKPTDYNGSTNQKYWVLV